MIHRIDDSVPNEYTIWLSADKSRKVTFDELAGWPGDTIQAAASLVVILQEYIEHWDEVGAGLSQNPDDPDFINAPRPQDIPYDTPQWIDNVTYYIKTGPPPFVYYVVRPVTVTDCVWSAERNNFVVTYINTRYLGNP